MMKKIIFFQIFDYRDVYFAIENNQAETYVFQNQFIEFTSSLVKRDDVSDVCIVSLASSGEYDQIMPNGIRAIGIPFLSKDKKKSYLEINKLMDSYQSTHAIVQVPLLKLLRKCISKRIKTYVMIADSFTGTGLRGFIWGKIFAYLLNNKYVELVSNHNYPASNLLKSFGVKAGKIIPWDFSWEYDINKYPIKVLTDNKKSWKLFYAGRILKEKGVGDIIRAVYLLKKKDIQASAVFAGGGDIVCFEKQAADLAVSDKVNFLNKVGHDQVISGMRNADIVIVPSQIGSSEGMPCTIYESFMVKTPFILSDHPMLKQGIKNGIFFKAGNPDSLVEAIDLLINNVDLYNRLSADSSMALNDLIVPFNFIQIIRHWLSNQDADKQWLRQHNLKELNRK